MSPNENPIRINRRRSIVTNNKEIHVHHRCTLHFRDFLQFKKQPLLLIVVQGRYQNDNDVRSFVTNKPYQYQRYKNKRKKIYS